MNRLLARIVTFVPLLLVMTVVIVHAQTPCQNCLQSPTGNVSLQGFIAAALMAMVKIAMPIITIFIVYSGFLFVTAQGNKTKLETAKVNFFYSVLGALLILSAWVLANLIGNTVTQLLGP